MDIKAEFHIAENTGNKFIGITKSQGSTSFYLNLAVDEAKELQEKLTKAIKESETPESLTLRGSNLEIKVGDVIVHEPPLNPLNSTSICRVTRLNNDMSFNANAYYPSTMNSSYNSRRASNQSGCKYYRKATKLEELFLERQNFSWDGIKDD